MGKNPCEKVIMQRESKGKRTYSVMKPIWRYVALFALLLIIGAVIVFADTDSESNYYSAYEYSNEYRDEGEMYIADAPTAQTTQEEDLPYNSFLPPGLLGDVPSELPEGCCDVCRVKLGLGARIYDSGEYEEYGYIGYSPYYEYIGMAPFYYEAEAFDGFIQVYLSMRGLFPGQYYETIPVYVDYYNPYFYGHNVRVGRRHGYELGGWVAVYLDYHGNPDGSTNVYARDTSWYGANYYSAIIIPTQPGGVRVYAVFRPVHSQGYVGISPFLSIPADQVTIAAGDQAGFRAAVSGVAFGNERLILLQGNITLTGATAATTVVNIAGQAGVGNVNGITIMIASAGTDFNTHTGPNQFVIHHQSDVLSTIMGRHFNVTLGSTLILSNVVLDGGFTQAAPDNTRGGISLTTQSNLYMYPNAVIRYSRASGGGAVNVAGASRFIMYGGHLYRNDAAGGSGGGVNITGNNSYFVMHNGLISHNAGSNGGGINVGTGTTVGSFFTMNGGTISHNLANAWGGGGGIFFTTSNTGVINNGYIEHNQAAHGGGIWIMGGNLALPAGVNPVIPGGFAGADPVVMNGGVVRNNTSGVGLGSHFSSLTTFANSPILNVPLNRHGGGGGIYICCGGRLIMNGGIIEENIGRVGAGVFISHSSGGNRAAPRAHFILRSGTIRYNHATVSHLPPAGSPITPNLGNVNFPNIGTNFDRDGGGLFITEAGNFVMENHEGNVPGNIYFYGNTADNSGGGIYWGEGRWYTDDFTGNITIRDNESHGEIYREVFRQNNGRDYFIRANAEYPLGIPYDPNHSYLRYVYRFTTSGGGGLFLAYGTLNMNGTWVIEDNTAHRGGGVFLTGDESPYNPAISNDPHPDMGHGHLVMHTANSTIYNNHSHTSGGGVYIYRDGLFTMHDGSIEYNSSALYGGGVYVLNPTTYFDSEFRVYGGYITRNTAIYGGGVYLMYRGHMYASGVMFSYNSATRMGGAIFTQLVDYGYMLTGEPVPHDILTPTPPDPNEVFHAFTNITTTNTVRFRGNTAATIFHAPYNAYTLTNIKWDLYNVTGSEHLHVSALMHPFNNFDINYVRPVYFYKTNMAIYETPRSIENLPGAVFTLDIWAYDSGDGQYDWRQYTTAAGVPVISTSEANGRVALFVFTPGYFRMREITPPIGYALPPGHWYFEKDITMVDDSMGVPSPLMFIVDPPPVPCSRNSPFHYFVRLDRVTGGTIDEPGSQEARMRWHVGNAAPIALTLHKTSDGIFGMNPQPTLVSQINNMLLPGAVFAIYRYAGTGTPAANVQMPAAGWVRTFGLHTSTNDPDYPIELRLGFRGDQVFSYYQLVELYAPPGYAVPFGQWRIRLDVHDLATHDIGITVQTVGAAPNLVRLTGHTGYVFALGNRRDIELPLTGGMGMGVFNIAGIVALVTVAAAVSVLFITKKRNDLKTQG